MIWCIKTYIIDDEDGDDDDDDDDDDDEIDYKDNGWRQRRWWLW